MAHQMVEFGIAEQHLRGNAPPVVASPPARSISTQATFLPSCAARMAPTYPAGPPPMTMRSWFAIEKWISDEVEDETCHGRCGCRRARVKRKVAGRIAEGGCGIADFLRAQRHSSGYAPSARAYYSRTLVSISSVTGPSLTDATCIIAPKRPAPPAPQHFAKFAHHRLVERAGIRGSPPGANLARAFFRAGKRVNWLTRDPAPLSSTLRFHFTRFIRNSRTCTISCQPIQVLLGIRRFLPPAPGDRVRWTRAFVFHVTEAE